MLPRMSSTPGLGQSVPPTPRTRRRFSRPMRWPYFPLLASSLLPLAFLPLPLAPGANAQTAARAKPLLFGLSLEPVTRDSSVFYLHGQERGWAAWLPESRRQAVTQAV